MGDRRARSETVRKAWALIIAYIIERIKHGHLEERKQIIAMNSTISSFERFSSESGANKFKNSDDDLYQLPNADLPRTIIADDRHLKKKVESLKSMTNYCASEEHQNDRKPSFKRTPTSSSVNKVSSSQQTFV